MKNRPSLIWRIVLLVAVFAGAFVFAQTRREALVREGTDLLQRLLSREADLDVKIGKISGKLTGYVRFDDVRVEDPALPEDQRTLFRAERVELRYRVLDLLAKKFDSKISLKAVRPVVQWIPRIGLHGSPWHGWESVGNMLLAQRHRLEAQIEDMTLIYGADRQTYSGISYSYKDDRFEAVLPLSHLDLVGNDVSTQLNLRGKLEWGALRRDDRLEAEVFTQGTIVNWQPLPWESRVEFVLTRDRVEIISSDLMGGMRLEGAVDLEPSAAVHMSLNLKDYPVQNFAPLLSRGGQGAYDGHLTLEARFDGPWDAMKTDAHATLVGGKAGKKHYKVMNLHLNGVYPTLNLYDSHLTMQDGLQMKFADKTVEFLDLFSGRTYQKLISESDQDRVAMGDWEFSRPLDENEGAEFLVERALGKHARVQFRKFNEPEEKKLDLTAEDEDPTREMEVGFEYRLRSEDSLQYRVREDEQFVGVERKMSF